MTYESFCREYEKLYRYFYKSTDPNLLQIEDAFELLHNVSLQQFQALCRQIKASEDDMPRNIVSYFNAHIESIHHECNRDRTAEENQCAACCDGWVAVKIAEGNGSAVKYCQCPSGQYLKKHENSRVRIATATFQECQAAARANHGIFELKQ